MPNSLCFPSKIHHFKHSKVFLNFQKQQKTAPIYTYHIFPPKPQNPSLQELTTIKPGTPKINNKNRSSKRCCEQITLSPA
jgi:hypothetical protein